MMETVIPADAERSSFAQPDIPSVTATDDVPVRLYLYWFDALAFVRVKSELTAAGFRLVSAKMTPCQVMRASGSKVVYATPEVWSRMCVRQGSWYRESDRSGQYMMMSERRFPEAFDTYLDAEISTTDFVPDSLPSIHDLEVLVESTDYQDNKPAEWEEKTRLDAIMFKLFFTVTRVWGRGDNLKKHWLGHRANHANFLAGHFTTDVDGESVPYSVTENAGVCSSCVEYFNVSADTTRKMVRACPGAVTFGGAPRDVYLDVNPVRR